ncbi:MAG: SRPBCC family protein [Actinomycetales bacterium]|nr:SRPBCC family protein [Actinomycetales bacterium]
MSTEDATPEPTSTGPTAPDPTRPQVYQIFIRATPEAIWEAITRPEFTTRYFHGARVETTGEVGTPFRYLSPDGTAVWGDETVLEAEPGRRLVVGWRSLYDPRFAAEPASRVTWEIDPQDGGYCLLTVVHDRLESSPATAANVQGPGWMMVLSGLKTLLETGEPLVAR